MLNRFLAVGDLQEARIDLFKTHIKIRLSIAIDKTKIITCQQTISQKWDGAKSWYSIIPLLHPRIDSYVYANNQRYYTMKKTSTTTRLLVSGNVNEYRNSLYYNMQYCRIERDNAPCGLNIEIDGQWLDSGRFLNICGDSPRVFTIKRPDGCEGCICRLRLEYDSGYSIEQNQVITHPSGLSVVDCKRTNAAMNQEEIDKWMLEYEIISS